MIVQTVQSGSGKELGFTTKGWDQFSTLRRAAASPTIPIARTTRNIIVRLIGQVITVSLVAIRIVNALPAVERSAAGKQ